MSGSVLGQIWDGVTRTLLRARALGWIAIWCWRVANRPTADDTGIAGGGGTAPFCRGSEKDVMPRGAGVAMIFPSLRMEA